MPPDEPAVDAPAPPIQPAEANHFANHFVPGFDIVVFDFLLNRYGKHFIDGAAYDVNASSVRRNLHSAWVLDNDPFSTNQFLHPYQGAMYHGFARSAGLNYWESLGYTFAGSMLWELAGETTTPSRNDQIASGIGGSFLGEPLFRMANLMLEKSEHLHLPLFWRELTAAVISPATGFNRLAYGGRFKAVLPKIPSSVTPLCSAESRPFESPAALPNICDIIARGSTPFIRNAPRSRCSGQMKSSCRRPKQVPTMIASWPMPV